MAKDDFAGTKVLVPGEVIEHLVLGKKEWFEIRLANNQRVVVDRSKVKIDKE